MCTSFIIVDLVALLSLFAVASPTTHPDAEAISPHDLENSTDVEFAGLNAGDDTAETNGPYPQQN